MNSPLKNEAAGPEYKRSSDPSSISGMCKLAVLQRGGLDSATPQGDTWHFIFLTYLLQSKAGVLSLLGILGALPMLP